MHLFDRGAAIHLSDRGAAPHLSDRGAVKIYLNVIQQLLDLAPLHPVVSAAQLVNLSVYEYVLTPPCFYCLPELLFIFARICIVPVWCHVLIYHVLPEVRVCPPLIIFRHKLCPYKHPGRVGISVLNVQLTQ